MKKSSIHSLAVLSLILMAVLAVPVAALPVKQRLQESLAVPDIPAPVKDDLLGIHMKYRLQQFDLNMQKAGDVISVLDKYKYNTTSLKQILSEITATRPALESAVNANDMDALKSVNQKLLDLWKEFRKTVKSLFRT